MSGTEEKTQDQKPKISKLAIASVSLGILCFLILYFRNLIRHPLWARVLVWHSMILLGIAGLVLGVVAIIRIKKSRWILKGGGLAVAGIVFGVSISLVWWAHRARLSRDPPSPCWYNLRKLGREMLELLLQY